MHKYYPGEISKEATRNFDGIHAPRTGWDGRIWCRISSMGAIGPLKPCQQSPDYSLPWQNVRPGQSGRRASHPCYLSRFLRRMPTKCRDSVPARLPVWKFLRPLASLEHFQKFILPSMCSSLRLQEIHRYRSHISL